MKRFFKFFGSFLKTAPKLLLFELLFKLLLTAVGTPLMSFLINAAMKNAGVSYLSASSLKKFLLNPFTVLVIILILFIVAVFTIIELSSLIAGYAFSREHKKITIAGMLKCGLHAFAKAFRGSGILSFLGFMLVVPLAQFTLSSCIISAPLIPIVRSLINTHWKYACIAAYILLELLILYILSTRCYCLHYLVLTNNNFSDCMKKSRSCIKGKRLKTFLTLIMWSLIMLAFAAAATFIISFLIIFGIKGFSRPDAVLISSLKVLSYAWKVFIAVSAVISAPFIIGSLTDNFMENKERDSKIVLPESGNKKVPKAVKFASFTVLIALSVFLNFSYIQQIYKGNINVNMGIFNRTQVTAHRGFSYKAPENTLYAFEEAINAGTDYIELDIQQTSDGQIVVFHDQKLDRTSDGTGPLSEYTYEELLEFSLGNWFKRGETDFSDARIMLLSEVLELAKDNNCMLNIEVKKSGNSTDTARKAAEMLVEYDMTDSCYITSFSYSALKEVKKTNSSIKTAIIANVVSPSLYSQLKYIDALSLNYIFVNQSIISNAHKGGKRVFVWTVNNRSDMERMISIGADNIITDRPDIAVNAVYSYGKGDFVLSLLSHIFGI